MEVTPCTGRRAAASQAGARSLLHHPLLVLPQLQACTMLLAALLSEPLLAAVYFSVGHVRLPV